jgi:hypothetical protein
VVLLPEQASVSKILRLLCVCGKLIGGHEVPENETVHDDGPIAWMEIPCLMVPASVLGCGSPRSTKAITGNDSGCTNESGTGTEDGTSQGAETPAAERAGDGEKKSKSPEGEEDAKEPEPE